MLWQRLPSIYGLDPSDVRIKAASEFENSARRLIPVSAGHRYGNTIYLNPKFVNGGARRLADIALHEGMHLRDFQLGNSAAQRLLQWAEFWTPKSPLTALVKIWPYVAMPSEIAARSAGVYYLSNNLLIDILPRSAYAFVRHRR